MYVVEWLSKDETVIFGEGWKKILDAEEMKKFIVETLKEGGKILSVELA